MLCYEVMWLYVNNGDWMSKDKSGGERGEMQMGKWV